MVDANLKLVDGNLIVVNQETGDIMSESGPWVPELKAPPYTVPLGEAICQLVREGNTYKVIVEKLKLKSVQVLYQWRAKHPDFKHKLDEAKKDRADYYHDKVLEIAEKDQIAKEDVPGQKLRTDLYRWAAEKANPEYSNKGVQGPSGPMKIIIDTGIRRVEDNPIEAEVTHVNTEDQHRLHTETSPSEDI